MHDYSLTLVLPWWGILGTLALAVGISLWAYGRPLPPLLPRQRLLLGMLRALALSTLVVALWQPVMRISSSHREEPRVAVLLDNSASMRLQDASGSRAERYRSALQQLHDLLVDQRAHLLRFDASVRPLERWHPDSLSLDGIATNFAHAFRWVASEARTSHLRAVLLLSDGVVTAGESPVPEAEALGIPIVTVLVGDTTPQRDAAVQSLLANERIPLGSRSEVFVSLSADQLGGETAQLELWEDDRRLATVSLPLRSEQRLYTVRFPYEPKTEGIHQLRVRILPLPGERSRRNNEARTFVDVVRVSRRLLLFAGSPSPDLAFLRRELQRNPLLQLSTFVHKDGASFYEGEPSAELLRQADALLLLDFPTRTTPEPLVRALVEIASKGCPIAYIAGPLTDPRKLRLLESVLPITVRAPGSLRELTATLHPTPSGALHPLLKLPEETAPSAWNQLPPLFLVSGLAQPKPTAELLAVAHASVVQEPLLLVQQQPVRSVALLGYGLYRWKLMGYAAELARGRVQQPDYLATFVTQLTQWLLSTPRERLLRIRTTQRLYIAGEPIQFWASLTDPLGNPIDEATVRLRITGTASSRELLLSPSGQGTYQGTLPELPSGEYTFTGEALLQGTRLGTDRGHFSVGDIGLEERSLRADAELLQTLAQRTGGAFFLADSASQAWKFIQQLPGFRPVIMDVRRELALWYSPWLLVAALLGFSAEWILRRRWGVL
ncbi:hypothetical protein HRbin21_00250 [bacterium HR21]|nr:hypothetical protein HRbin21_00250 [bacterium HR21]